LGPADLSHALDGLASDDARILVGIGTQDDAAVFALDADRALVQTLDVITPVVDDPFVYGQIAAANSLSDIFAMGAEVMTAMNIVGFDGCHHSPEVLREILAGGADKVRECGGVLVGGHTIDAPEMTYGLSVTGIVHPQRIYRNNTLRVGDVLVLTKPIGMGVMSTAIKADMVATDRIPQIAAILAQLNHRASQIMQRFDVSACTDVTGFGLAGHALEMADDRVSIAFEFDALPLIPEAIDLAAMGIIPEGTYNNQTHVQSHTQWKDEPDDSILFYDAQTSGGLLIAVREQDASALTLALIDAGYAHSTVVGHVLPKGDFPLVVL